MIPSLQPSDYRRRQSRWLSAALIYFVFIAYGSLLPFDFTFHPGAEAWQRFLAMPYLTIDVQSRADWLANILLYVPLGFLASGAVALPEKPFVQRIPLLIIALLLCIGTAVLIEFTQVYFPPRTVCWNDMIAETIGSVIGFCLYFSIRKNLTGMVGTLNNGGENARRLALALYTTGYLVLSLFPYDFLLSRNELHWKLSTNMVAPFIADNGCTRMIICVTKLGAEVLATLPFGFLLALVKPRYSVVIAAALGAALGLTIELLQFFLASGISQGASILTRALGVALGWYLGTRVDSLKLEETRTYLRWILIILALPYMALVAAFNGWLTHDWLSLASGLHRINLLNFLPFYYYYYTSEAVATASLLVQAAMYAPIGVAYWVWWPEKGGGGAASIAALLALGIETGKLFVADKHPDPTDIIIAATAAAIAYMLLRWWNRADGPVIFPTAEHQTSRDGDGKTHKGIRTISLLLAACAAYAAWHYPLGGFWPIVLLTGYAVVLWRFPDMWLVVVSALLPIMDFAPWTGWFFLDEFDLLLLITLSVSLWKIRVSRPFDSLSTSIAVLISLFGLSCVFSMAVGLLPLQSITDPNAFSSYYSHYNALRVGKGFIWALAFLPLLAYHAKTDINLSRRFTYGMVAGLTGVVLAVLWERYVFPGLFNFTDDYRITATFSSMHTGGGHIEGYLALALPFVVIWIYQSKTLVTRAAGIILFALGIYALLVTFSRGGYLALAVEVCILLLGIYAHARRGAVGRTGFAIFIPLLLLLAALATSIPILEGTYIRSRFAQVSNDLGVRINHWQGALSMTDPGWQTTLFGMGLGRYPETYYWKNREGIVPARYSYETEGRNVFLRLGAGDTLYIEQPVAVLPNHNYVLSMDLRSRSPNASLTVPVCEKSLLYSFECEWKSFTLKNANGQWERYEHHFNSKSISQGSWLSRRPVKLSLFNAGTGTLIDIDDIVLADENGKNLVTNGDFSRASENWFFATDNHLPWHIKNLAVQLVFDQGWLGLIVFSGLLLAILRKLFNELRQGILYSTGLLASIVGFLAVGLFDSLFDAPRLTMLFLVLVFLSGLLPGSRKI